MYNEKALKQMNIESTSGPQDKDIAYMEENLELLTDVLRASFWTVDCNKDGTFKSITYSQNVRELLGRKTTADFPDSLDSWRNNIHPNDKDKVVAQFFDALADKTGKRQYNIEYRMRLPDGSYKWYLSRATIKRRADGTAMRMAGIFIDVDQDVRAKMLAQSSEAFHRAYTEANLCEFYIDLKENTFIPLKVADSLLSVFEVNQSWDALTETYIRDYISPHDQKAAALFLSRDYISKMLSGEQGELNLEATIILDDGPHFVRHVILRDTAVDGSHYVLSFVRDITEAKNEAAVIDNLTTEKKNLDQILAATAKLFDRYAIVNLDKNDYQAFKLLGDANTLNSAGSFKNMLTLLDGKFRPLEKNATFAELLSIESLHRVLKTPSVIYRFEYTTHDESIIKSLAVTAISWNAQNKPEKIVMIAQDITASKKQELRSRQALEDAFEVANKANQAKTQFLSNMSHDIRTPMNAIIGMTAIANASIDNQERVQDCLEKISRSSNHLLGLINEVLDMSRIESGKMELDDDDFNLSDLLDTLIVISRQGMTEHHHKFDVNLGRIVHEDVRGDKMRLQQLFTNILSNAIKYTPDGGHISLTINEVSVRPKEYTCYEITITDNGIGMSKEFQKIMFDPFTRADDQRITKVQGTGLGMAIAKNIVNMMSGSMKVESELGKGTKFTISIFLKLQRKKYAKEGKLNGLPILLVNYDKASAISTGYNLHDMGMEEELALSEAEALALAESRTKNNMHYFAVLLDVPNPKELAQKLRQLASTRDSVIIMAGLDEDSLDNAAQQAGIDRFIAKPLFRSRLTTSLTNILEKRKSDRTAHSSCSLEEIAKQDYSSKRILIVEDNELNLEIAQTIIGMTGVAIETANNGKEAVDKFAAAPNGYYDLIFMDIQMPLMNGYEATEAIRALDRADAQSTPIVAMTANAFSEDIINAKKAGMNEHIAKPLDMGRLQEILQKWL